MVLSLDLCGVFCLTVTYLTKRSLTSFKLQVLSSMSKDILVKIKLYNVRALETDPGCCINCIALISFQKSNEIQGNCTVQAKS